MSRSIRDASLIVAIAIVVVPTVAAQDIVGSGDLLVDNVSTRNNLFLNRDGPDGNSSLFFFDLGSSVAEEISWFDTGSKFFISDDLDVDGTIEADGALIRPGGSLDVNGSIFATGNIGTDGSFLADGSVSVLGGIGAGASIGADIDLTAGDDVELVDELLFTGSSPSIQVRQNDADFPISTDGGQMRWFTDVDNDTGESENYVWYNNGISSGDRTMRLDSSGNLEIDGTLTENFSFDIAEAFHVDEPIESGTLVRVVPERPDAVAATTGARDPHVIGVVSAQPGVYMGGGAFGVDDLRTRWGDELADEYQERRDALIAEAKQTMPHLVEKAERLASGAGLPGTDASDEVELEQRREALEERRYRLEQDAEAAALDLFFERNFAPVALSGRVPVKVDASKRPIAIGDYLTPGPEPGIAVKATGPGPVVGTALEPLAEGTGSVLTFVNRGWYGGPADGTGSGPERADSDTERVPGLTEDEWRELESRLASMVSGEVHEVLANAGPAGGSATTATRPAEALRVAGENIASFRPISEPLEAGDVVVADRDHPGLLEAGETASDPAVVGVVVGQPGVLTGARIESMTEVVPELARRLADARERRDTETVRGVWEEMRRAFESIHAPVTTSGIVEAKVDASYGPVAVGDLLTASPTEGHAMRADPARPGTIVGKALEPLADGTDTLEILVMLR